MNAPPPFIPGMIEPVEQAMLYDLGASLQLAPTEIVCEFGAYFGKSTWSLAQGLQAGPTQLDGRTLAPLHTWDLFSCAETGLFAQHVVGHAQQAGTSHLLARSQGRLSWLQAFDHHMQGLPPGLLQRHVGALRDARKPACTIAAAFFDAPKWYEEYLGLMREFGPAMKPGCTLVFQDYFYHWSATVIAAVQIMLNRGLVQPVETAASSLMVRLLQPLDAATIEQLHADYLATDVAARLDEAHSYFSEFSIDQADRFLPRLRLAAIQHLVETGHRPAAEDRLQALLRSLGGPPSQSLTEDFMELRKHDFSLRGLYELDTAVSPA